MRHQVTPVGYGSMGGCGNQGWVRTVTSKLPQLNRPVTVVALPSSEAGALQLLGEREIGLPELAVGISVVTMGAIKMMREGRPYASDPELWYFVGDPPSHTWSGCGHRPRMVPKKGGRKGSLPWCYNHRKAVVGHGYGKAVGVGRGDFGKPGGRRDLGHDRRVLEQLPAREKPRPEQRGHRHQPCQCQLHDIQGSENTVLPSKQRNSNHRFCQIILPLSHF